MKIVNEFQPNYCNGDLTKNTPRDVLWINPTTVDDVLILQKIAEKYKLPILYNGCIMLENYQKK